jgi:hypothetical protein
MSLKIWLDEKNNPPKGWTIVNTMQAFEEALFDPDANITQISLSANFCGDGVSAAKLIEEAAESGHLGSSVLALHEPSTEAAINGIIKQCFQSANFSWASLED